MKANLQQIIENLYLSTPDDVVSVGYGYKIKNNTKTSIKSIVFGVKEKKSTDQLQPHEILPSSITLDDNTTIQTDVVQREVELSSLSNCFQSLDSSSNDHRLEKRPLVGGISVSLNESDAGTGTLGGIVKDWEDGNIAILSNAHVLARDQFINSNKGENAPHWNATLKNIIQPGVADSGVVGVDYIGYVKRYYPIDISGINYIDAAVGSLNPKMAEPSSFSILGLNNSNPIIFASSSEIDSILDNSLYVPCDNNKIVVINTNNNTIAATFSTASQPYDVRVANCG